jgi:hypothetical protein
LATAIEQTTTGATVPDRPWWVVGQGAAALAAGMGAGRAVHTPILPVMHAQTGLSTQLGAELATANYLGYLIGALAAIVAPVRIRSRLTLRLSLMVLVGTLALMPATHVGTLWLVVRVVAGIVSALIFVNAANTMLTGLRTHAHQLRPSAQQHRRPS